MSKKPDCTREDEGPWDLRFEHRYTFSEYPLLHITLANPDALEMRLEQPGYVDTGSTYTSLPAEIAEELGLEVRAGEATSVTAGGRRLPGFLRPLHLQHEDLGSFHLDEAFVHYEGPSRVLLGRDLLEQITVGFRFDERAMYMTRHSPTREYPAAILD